MFRPFASEKIGITQKRVLNMVSSDSQIDKPQRVNHNVNINTGAHSINSERASLRTKLL